jgi:mono/diheme cytochrome c family protein
MNLIGTAHHRSRRPASWFGMVVTAIACAGLTGCRSEMYDQPRYEPMEASAFFENGTSARPLVAGTVAREDARGGLNDVRDVSVFFTGMEQGKPATALPFPFDRSVLERGQQRYRIFCTPCHGELGDGRGIIVRRGFTPPPRLDSDELRNAPLGHFFDVITNGHGVMYSYAARIPPRDRWAIATYIRALQLSQHASEADLSDEDRHQLEGEKP